MTDQPTAPPDDEQLDTVQERIDDAKAAADVLHDTDALGDVGEEYGSGRSRADDRHGAFEPSADD